MLDVRAKSEYDAGHIPGSTRLHGGRVMWHLDELPHEKPIVLYCQTGSRSAVIASALRPPVSTMWSSWRAATRAG